jgi:hypothetical protein
VPPWQTIDPDKFDPAIHEQQYGGGSEARLLSGIAGHNLCIPFWGHPSSPEYAAGATFHGEAGLVTWQAESTTSEGLQLSAILPRSDLRIRRDIRLSRDTVVFDSSVTNLKPWDRPIAWCEHVTFGPPFLSARETVFDASLGEGFITGRERDGTFLWPEGRGELKSDLRQFSAIAHRDLVNSFVVNDTADGSSYFRVSNANFGIAVEYRFSVRDFDWLNVWENNDARMQTRGMEFSNTPCDGSMRKLIAKPTVLGRKAYDWIDALGTLTKRFSISVRDSI